jgi:hypothetical protein
MYLKYFLSFNDLLKIIQDVSVKYKFSFKIIYKNIKRIWYRYSNRDCLWLIIVHLNKKNYNEIIVDKIIFDYIYIGNK